MLQFSKLTLLTEETLSLSYNGFYVQCHSKLSVKRLNMLVFEMSTLGAIERDPVWELAP